MPAARPMDAETLRQRLAAGDPTIVLDIRTGADRAEWWIEPSRHLDAYDALARGETTVLETVSLPPTAPVVAVCRAGITAQRAAQALADRGLEAYFLEGGMRAWSTAWNVAEVPGMLENTSVLQVRRAGKGCLSYLIGSEGDAAVIDPSLDASVYHALAQARGWRITSVLDTHIHADHVSRGLRLAAAEGARYYLGRTRRARFGFTPLDEGAEVRVGASRLGIMATPGHTMESLTFQLDGRALLTGDTLFLDGVGRPDLEASSAEAVERAHLLHGSLRRLLGMPGSFVVLPGHTGRPVAFDGTALARSLTDLVDQDGTGVLSRWFSGGQASDPARFAEWILSRLPAMPPNHHRVVQLNEAGALLPDDVTELEAGANRCAVR